MKNAIRSNSDNILVVLKTFIKKLITNKLLNKNQFEINTSCTNSDNEQANCKLLMCIILKELH